MKAMETIQDVIEEAKVQTVWWGLCIFSLTYFLANTSTSMWMNLPVAILILLGLRWFNQIESRRNVMPAPRQSWEKKIYSLYFLNKNFLNKKQLSLNDTIPPPPSWKKNINSSVVEAAINDFIDKILNDFVINLWYSSITKDKEAPELIRGVIMDALGEISVRLKEIDILDLLTRDIVYLIDDHFESFRRNYAAIGTDVMETLSSDEGDERLKSHLMSSGELHHALISPENEYKFLQNIVDGIFSVVLGPREANCPLVRTIVTEIVTCLVVQPLLNLASPERINKAIFEQFSGEEKSANLASLSAIDNQPEWEGEPPEAIVPIVHLVDSVFQLDRGPWYRKSIFWILKQTLEIFMEAAVDDWLLREVSRLRNENTIAHGIRWAQDLLWPNGVFFTRVGDGQEASDETDPSEIFSQNAAQLFGMKVADFKQKLKAVYRANEIMKFLYDGAPKAIVWSVGAEKYRRCARDIFIFTQSNVCIKQLTFAILELLVRTVFPELQDLLRDIRENSHGQSE